MTLLHIALPKWPALVVWGEPVTCEQAAVLLLRTQDSYSCNAHQFAIDAYHATDMPLHAANEAFGFGERPEGFSFVEHWRALDGEARRVGKLELTYLDNNRITSSWVDGPKGWCAWNGHVGCDTFNIGKWPQVDEVLSEWQLLARTFPWLDLHAQLWSEEAGFNPETARPLVEFRVQGGEAVLQEPTIAVPSQRAEYNLGHFNDREAREVGVPGLTRAEKLEYLRWAAGLVRESLV